MEYNSLEDERKDGWLDEQTFEFPCSSFVEITRTIEVYVVKV